MIKKQIKKIRTKFDIKIKWNQMIRGKFEEKNQLKKFKENSNKKNKDQIKNKKIN